MRRVFKSLHLFLARLEDYICGPAPLQIMESEYSSEMYALRIGKRSYQVRKEIADAVDEISQIHREEELAYVQRLRERLES